MVVINSLFGATAVTSVVDVILLFYMMSLDLAFTLENVIFMALVFFIANFIIGLLIPGSFK